MPAPVDHIEAIGVEIKYLAHHSEYAPCRFGMRDEFGRHPYFAHGLVKRRFPTPTATCAGSIR